jgi:fatty-acyl-CoA synthase
MRHYAQRVAVAIDGRQLTFEQLGDRASRFANGLRRLGLVPGDRVAVLLENQLEYPEIDVGLALGGFVRVALNARLAKDDHAYVLEDCDARAIVTDQAFDDVSSALTDGTDLKWLRIGAHQNGDVAALDYDSFLEAQSSTFTPEDGDLSDDPAWISYTSGTTGRPKGVVLSHRALVQTAFNLMMEVGPRDEQEKILLPQPLSHGAGYFVLAYLGSGATVCPMKRFDPEMALHLGKTERIQTLKLVPTMLSTLLDTEKESPFTSVIYGASPISSTLLERALSEYGPILTQVYGQTEAPICITCLKAHDHARPGPHLASAGRPWRSVEVQILNETGGVCAALETGQVVVRGEHLMSGYHGKPELTSEVLKDGWLWTRDLGTMDENGFVYLLGRSDDIINSGGFNIAPKEVEDVLVTHLAILECAVVGVPDATWGEVVQAHIRLAPGQSATVEEIISFASPRLGFRRPRSIRFVESLPQTSYGKLDRNELRRLGQATERPNKETAS